MPPAERFLPRFAAEPPHEGLPYGRWAERLSEELLAAWESFEGDKDGVGEIDTIAWYPDRSWHGRTYVPATALTSGGYEIFGYVRFVPTGEGEPAEMTASVDFTDQTAERNPEWKLDMCDEVIGSWRGQGSSEAKMTLIWGRSLVPGGRIATAELGGIVVDQCALLEERFTLIAPDDFAGDLLEIKLFNRKGRQLAFESLYEEGEDEEDDGGGEAHGEGEETGG